MTPAYVLHRRPYRDSSLLIDFFTLSHGRLSCVARGAKKGKQKKAAILQPFTPLLIDYSGKSDLKTLTHCEATGHLPHLDSKIFYPAYYLNELLTKFLHDFDPLENVFVAYVKALEILIDQQDIENCLRRFELILLQSVGLGIQLDKADHGKSDIVHEKLYFYDLESGPVESVGTHHGPEVSGSTLAALKKGNLENTGQQKEARELMRYIISFHLNGYQFKSRNLYQLNKKYELKNESKI